ncbi:MAG: tRNA (N6-threonylcarbamoyladenosine(37)-N6)-methyltransferase TrmO [bacterium]|nr:tRNA (N6-threonylcarbamoyladenosine(37)-N6)-methyltransferase TrmO [Candidatus Kapabacteria bacterium]
MNPKNDEPAHDTAKDDIERAAPTLSVQPIGIISTPFDDRYRAPRQPGAAPVSAEGVITLNPGMNFEQALADLAGFDRIWVIYWFDRNAGWRPKVLPPRGPRVRRGVFATRSPHRPNPLGLSLLRLIDVRGRVLRVGDVDLLDGTPILDIKPYLAYTEAHPDASMGWLDDVVADEDNATRFDIVWSDRAREQAQWLASKHGVRIIDHTENVLTVDPRPHPYRRVTERADGSMELAIKSWRVVFTLNSTSVNVARIESGYAIAIVENAVPDSLHDHAAHVGFIDAWL